MDDSHIESSTKDCCKMLAECVRTVNTFPTGAARDLFSTYTSFNVIVDHLSDNMLAIANTILASQGIRDTLKKGEDCMNLLERANEEILDRPTLALLKMTNSNPGCKMTFTNSTRKSNIFLPRQGKPQVEFNIKVDNSVNTIWRPILESKPHSPGPFNIENYALTTAGKTYGYSNPFQNEICTFALKDSWLQVQEIRMTTLDETPYSYVDTEQKLQELCTHLSTVPEIALDVEHHNYRSYMGLTCLLQISTETGGDFIIDTLKLRGKLQGLNFAFTDPNIKKIVHGGKNDVLWLQRDCGLYIVGMFDTYEAANVLGFQRKKLSDLVSKFCGVQLDKKFQLADWSVRPLPADQLKYARLDTHYLIYIAAKLTAELITMDSKKTHLLEIVYNKGRYLCKQVYEKPVVDDESCKAICKRERFSRQSWSAMKRLYFWRDLCARDEDESVTYIMPDTKLIMLAQKLPADIEGVRACFVGYMSPIVKRDIDVIHNIILECLADTPGDPSSMQPQHTFATARGAASAIKPAFAGQSAAACLSPTASGAKIELPTIATSGPSLATAASGSAASLPATAARPATAAPPATAYGFSGRKIVGASQGAVQNRPPFHRYREFSRTAK